MNLIALPAFTDNYFWMFHDGRQAVAVDPGDSAPVLGALTANQLVPAAILVTHRHDDHVDGVDGVDALRPNLHRPVYGPKRATIPRPCVPHSARENGAVSTEPADERAALRQWINELR